LIKRELLTRGGGGKVGGPANIAFPLKGLDYVPLPVCVVAERDKIDAVFKQLVIYLAG
jgi:hypothetical protein